MREEEFKEKLDPVQYQVMRQGGTEKPFTGAYWDCKDPGTYVCAACGQQLFSSDAKFDSETGWPSFTEPVNREHVELVKDDTHGMSRIEVRCKGCGSHLGHVFDDGPQEKGGKRYCINSVCLRLERGV